MLADLFAVETDRHAARPLAEAPDLSDDFANGNTVPEEEVDQFEEVVLSLLLVELALLALVGDLADEIHLVLLVVHELLAGRLLTAHRGVRTREQLAKVRRDRHAEVSDHDNTALVQCDSCFQYLGTTREV